MKREDFMFSIGYSGVSAIVDRQARNRYGRMTSEELAEKGLFKAAFCGALYNDDTDEMEKVVEIYNNMSGADISSPVYMKRLLGVFSVPEEITKVTYI